MKQLKKTVGSCGPEAVLQPESAKSRLSVKVGQLLDEEQQDLPVWIRAPKRGVEFYSGFSRSKLYAEAAVGHIRSVSIRAAGQVKGTRLFHLGSIFQFIERCEQSVQTGGKENSETQRGGHLS
jgi:hypothetical protein